MERPTILLTGYAGFIGSEILRQLLDKGYNVVGVDNLSTGGSMANVVDVMNNTYDGFFDWYGHDIANGVAMEGLFDKYNIRYVINCAAESHVDRSWEEQDKFIRSNIMGPMVLANEAIKHHQCTKFLQVSTDEVFDLKYPVLNESTPLNPSNIYSSSKASAEFFLQNLMKAKGLPLIITNGANTYGPRQYYEKIIPKTIRSLYEGKKVPLYRTPARRMWLHVEDHVSGIISALLYGEVGRRYCLAPYPDQELYTDQLVAKIIELHGKRPEDHIDWVDDRFNYDLRYFMSNMYAVGELGWKPVKDIDEELPKVIEWYHDLWAPYDKDNQWVKE